jgi:hypothetical protein
MLKLNLKPLQHWHRSWQLKPLKKTIIFLTNLIFDLNTFRSGGPWPLGYGEETWSWPEPEIPTLKKNNKGHNQAGRSLGSLLSVKPPRFTMEFQVPRCGTGWAPSAVEILKHASENLGIKNQARLN